MKEHDITDQILLPTTRDEAEKLIEYCEDIEKKIEEGICEFLTSHYI
ncbi:MAG: hypothetical protein J5U19_14175 [Candidatus Methanoperedens sp.]|nr:hypothetical protein [Candidatus Methanoperedens sp.]